MLQRLPIKAAPAEPVWYVVRTNPRCEERACAGLLATGFHAHLPRGQKLTRRRFTKSRRPISFPLLTGYLFVGLSSATPHFFELRRVDGVQSVLGAGGRPLAIPPAVVAQFRDLEERGVFRESPHVRAFQRGDRVRIADGPLAGTTVHFEDYSGAKAARVVARLFGETRAVSVALTSLVKAEGAADA